MLLVAELTLVESLDDNFYGNIIVSCSIATGEPLLIILKREKEQRVDTFK